MLLKWGASSIFIILITLKCSGGVLNFEDENYFGEEADTYDWSKHPCRRDCQDGGKPQTCNYVLVIEQYSSMSKACHDCPFNMTDCFRPHCVPVDGYQKGIYAANRQIPAPGIEVCHNDLIVIEVRNNMLSDSTIIHWHGLNQNDSPYMDGVPYVTQCPILPGQTFRYVFKADYAGTFFYHSHIGSQLADGLFGALIIHPYPFESEHKTLYDYDTKYMIVNDWMHKQAEAAFLQEYYDTAGSKPDTFLINGLGPNRKFERPFDDREYYTPYAVFTIKKDKKYRIRLIDAGALDCPIEMSIDNHKMLIISLDSEDILPVAVDMLTIWPGERIGFVLCGDQPVDNYWIRFRGYGQCEGFAPGTGVHQVAILRYEGAEEKNPTAPVSYDIPVRTDDMLVFNPYSRGSESPRPGDIQIPTLSAMALNDESLSETVDHQYFISFDFYHVDNYDFHREKLYGYNEVAEDRRIGTMQLNHINLKLPTFPILPQRDMIRPEMFCNETNIHLRKHCTKEQCACTHLLEVKLNSVVELIFVDEGNFNSIINHPLHLHGHFFRVVATEKLDAPVTIEKIRQLDREGKIKRRLDRPPKKDTIKAPAGGYTIVRWYANNPGYWFFHCHFEEHNNIGMALIFKVGEHEDFLPVPDDFPTCGHYRPTR